MGDSFTAKWHSEVREFHKELLDQMKWQTTVLEKILLQTSNVSSSSILSEIDQLHRPSEDCVDEHTANEPDEEDNDDMEDDVHEDDTEVSFYTKAVDLLKDYETIVHRKQPSYISYEIISVAEFSSVVVIYISYSDETSASFTGQSFADMRKFLIECAAKCDGDERYVELIRLQVRDRWQKTPACITAKAITNLEYRDLEDDILRLSLYLRRDETIEASIIRRPT